MTGRNETEKDFHLKTTIRSILWAQGYSTRVDALLAYNYDPRGKSNKGKAGLTDLDVLGVRLDSGFRVHTVVADCKTSRDKVPERLFWLAGVSKFFGSDVNLLVRSQSLPDHAPPLARTLDITLVGPDDLTILMNTYLKSNSRMAHKVWRDFLSAELLGEVLSRLSRLPESLSNVDRYRETGYWMEEPYRQLQKVILALQYLAKESGAGPTFRLIFADFVWLYTLTLWRTCEHVNANGLSRLSKELEMYIYGDETGLKQIRQMKQGFETLARKHQENIALPILPSYYSELLELLGRCARRPYAVAKMARRAEWLVVAQMVGNLGGPPWEQDDDDFICNKLLGDVAQFLVRASGLKPIFIEEYLRLLEEKNSKSVDSEHEYIDTEEQQKQQNIDDIESHEPNQHNHNSILTNGVDIQNLSPLDN